MTQRFLATLAFAFFCNIAANAGNKHSHTEEIEFPLTIEGELIKLDLLIKQHLQVAYSKLEKYYNKHDMSDKRKIALALTSSALFNVQQYTCNDETAAKYFADAHNIANDIVQHMYQRERNHDIKVDIDPNWLDASSHAQKVFAGNNFSNPWPFARQYVRNLKIKLPSRGEIEKFIRETRQLGDDADRVFQLAYRFVMERMMDSLVKFIGSSKFETFNAHVMDLCMNGLSIETLLTAFNLGKDAFFSKDELDFDYLPGLKLLSHKNNVPFTFEEVSNSTESDNVHYHPHVGLPQLNIPLVSSLFL